MRKDCFKPTLLFSFSTNSYRCFEKQYEKKAIIEQLEQLYNLTVTFIGINEIKLNSYHDQVDVIKEGEVLIFTFG
jgi:hypothetical protein